MSDFPDFLASKLCDGTERPENTLVILPTRRGAAFVKNRLAAKLGDSTSWLPQFTTLNHWVASIADLDPVDELELKFACYRAYVSVMKTGAQSFSEFFSWADILIRDFNEIESQLIPRMPFFKELTDYSEIEHFSFLESPLSEKQENYRSFWRALPDIQEKLNKILLADGLAYGGLMQRVAVEKIKTHGPGFEGRIIAAGLNTLTRGEFTLLKTAQDAYGAEIIFDADRYYLDDPGNKAGLFIRKNLSGKLGTVHLTAEPLDKKARTITLGEAAQRIDQIQIAAGILKEMSPEERKETALVLADESLLIPLLNLLPAEMEQPNITMGISVSDSTFAAWLTLIFTLLNKSVWRNEAVFLPTSDLIRLRAHPFTALICPTDKFLTSLQPGFTSITHIVSTDNRETPWLGALCDFWVAVADQRPFKLASLAVIMGEMLDPLTFKSIEIMQGREGLALVRRAAHEISRLGISGELSGENFASIVQGALSGARINSLGDPIDDMQIMGLLETRPLSFKRLIVCSVNEEILPGSSNHDSFIPFEIRRHHGMAGRAEKEAVYAYNFFRLLQHAEYIDLIYCTGRSNGAGGEKSRYIQQIEYLLRVENPALLLKYRSLKTSDYTPYYETTALQKTPEMIEAIKRHLTGALSVSSLNLYLDDSLEWFYKYVLKLEEPEVATIDAAGFGSAVHEVLENLYKPYKNQKITRALLEDMLQKMPDMLLNTLRNCYPGTSFDTGMNSLQFETAREMLNNYLKSEISAANASAGTELIDVEAKFSRDFTFNHPMHNFTVRLFGVIDKIEKNAGGIRILDYKTGSVSAKDVRNNLDMPFNRDSFNNLGKTLQLYMYHYLAEPKYGSAGLTAEILSLLSPSNRNLTVDYSRDKMEAYETFLQMIITEMLDTAIPLARNEKFAYRKFIV